MHHMLQNNISVCTLGSGKWKNPRTRHLTMFSPHRGIAALVILRNPKMVIQSAHTKYLEPCMTYKLAQSVLLQPVN